MGKKRSQRSCIFDWKQANVTRWTHGWWKRESMRINRGLPTMHGLWGPPGKLQNWSHFTNSRRRFMTEILPIWRKNSIQSINQSINQSTNHNDHHSYYFLLLLLVITLLVSKLISILFFKVRTYCSFDFVFWSVFPLKIMYCITGNKIHFN